MIDIQSCIYTGTVRHRRFQHRHHQFSYKLFMMFVDVDELQNLVAKSPLWSLDKKNIACFMHDDYLPRFQGSMREKLHAALHEMGFVANNGRIFLLANWRYFNYLINPISCYYCYDDNNRLQYIVSEVTNTPWGERQLYVLPCDPSSRNQRLHFDKAMHVSPFYAMNMHYQLNSCEPASQLSLHINMLQDRKKVFDATLSLSRKPLTAVNLFCVLLRYPFMTVKVLLAIYWQALKLAIKGVPIQPHPDKCPEIRDENP